MGFRWFVRTLALRLQLAGWVKNLPDGTVEIAAHGSDDRLKEFQKAVLRGPEGALVTAVEELVPVNEALEHPFSVTHHR